MKQALSHLSNLYQQHGTHISSTIGAVFMVMGQTDRICARGASWVSTHACIRITKRLGDVTPAALADNATRLLQSIEESLSSEWTPAYQLRLLGLTNPELQELIHDMLHITRPTTLEVFQSHVALMRATVAQLTPGTVNAMKMALVLRDLEELEVVASEALAEEAEQMRGESMWIYDIQEEYGEAETLELTPHDVYLHNEHGPSLWIRWRPLRDQVVAHHEAHYICPRPKPLTPDQLPEWVRGGPPWVMYLAAPDGLSAPVRHEVTSWNDLCRNFARYVCWEHMRTPLDLPAQSHYITDDTPLDAWCFGADLQWRTVREAWDQDHRYSLVTETESRAEATLVVAVDLLETSWVEAYSVRALRAEWDHRDQTWSRVWMQLRTSPYEWEELSDELRAHLWQLLSSHQIRLIPFTPI